MSKCIGCPSWYKGTPLSIGTPHLVHEYSQGRAGYCTCDGSFCDLNCGIDFNQYGLCGQTRVANCPPGRGLIGGLCTNCVAGKYKDISGISACKSCGNPDNVATGPPFSQSINNCVCEAGYGLKDINSGACSQCPANSYSFKARYNLAVCTCNSGYVKVGTNPFTCEPPPECAAGSTGPAGSCAQCAPGKYKAASGSAPCDDCVPAGTYSETPGSSACTLCPSGKYSAVTRASTSTTCQCAAGSTG